MLTPNVLEERFQESPLAVIAEPLVQASVEVLLKRRHGHFDSWLDVIEALPDVTPSVIELGQDAVVVGSASDLESATRQVLEQSMLSFHPWRKGPFELFGTYIDSEWRSNLKWKRLEAEVAPLAGRTVLDVGCGNGYYLFRMLGQGASYVLGIDPGQLFVAQFNAVRKYLPQARCEVLPLRCEEMPFEDLHRSEFRFDTVFSMGILYHRKDPVAHIRELLDMLHPGGELVLETLVVDSAGSASLVPDKTYAKMPNVSLVPTVPDLVRLLRKGGMGNIRVVDVSVTTPDEQRSTDWMQFESLPDFLDPENHTRTIEGYPAPTRALVICAPA